MRRYFELNEIQKNGLFYIHNMKYEELDMNESCSTQVQNVADVHYGSSSTRSRYSKTWEAVLRLGNHVTVYDKKLLKEE